MTRGHIIIDADKILSFQHQGNPDADIGFFPVFKVLRLVYIYPVAKADSVSQHAKHEVSIWRHVRRKGILAVDDAWRDIYSFFSFDG